MKDLKQIKKEYYKSNKFDIDERMKIHVRYLTLYEQIGEKDHDAYLKGIYEKAKKDMKWNLKCKRKYSTVNECFLDRTIPEYYVMAQNAMSGIFTDILSYRDWTETAEDLNIMESKSPLMNVLIFLKRYFDEWESLAFSEDYETNFRERFEKRFGDPEYMFFVPEHRVNNIIALYLAVLKYFNFLTDLGIRDAELLEFMNNEKFVGQANTNFIWWNRECSVVYETPEEEKIPFELRDETKEPVYLREKYFRVFDFAVKNPHWNKYAVKMLNVAFEYQLSYGITVSDEIHEIHKMNESFEYYQKYMRMYSHGYLAYFPKPFGVD